MKRAFLVAAAMFASLLIHGSWASADTGGPDAGGYRFIDNNSDGGPAFQFVDISSTGTKTPCALIFEDDCTDVGIPIGFPFAFYGETWTEIAIDLNGVLVFTDEPHIYVYYENESLPTDPAGDYPLQFPAIFAFWDDLNPGYCEGSDVYYQTIGSDDSQRFVVQWTSCHYNYDYYPDCTISVQAQLLEGSNDILLFYDDTIFGENGCDEQAQTGNALSNLQPKRPSPNGGEVVVQALEDIDEGASATVGIQDGSGIALQYTYAGERPLTNGLAICFYEGTEGMSCGEEPRVREERPRPPSIGAGLSGLFQGQPTPLPTAPAAVAPAATSPVITPPRTGDAGLADQTRGYGAAGALALGVISGLLVVARGRLRT